MALAGALLFEWLSGSLFTGGGKGLGDPYTIVVTPVQLMKEWGRYAGAGLNQMSGIGLGLVGLAAARFLPGLGSRKWLGLVMPAAGALAWLPNAALPNHYSPGYSWNGTNLMFAPVLLLPFLWKVGRWARACSIIVSVLILGSPALSGGAYKDNAWALEQEARQRNVLTVLQGLMERLPSETDSYRVLVTGIDFVFSPFDHGLSMRSFPHGRITEFEVLAYTPRVPGVSPVPRLELNSGVTFISPREITFSRYSRVWAFRSDGTLAKEARDPSGLANRPHDESELSLEELLIFPNLLGILGDPSHPDPARKPPDGYTYLACGTALLNYQEAAGAEKCLAQSAKLIPNNPYPYFYLGLIREKRGLTESARVLLEKAIDLDDPKSPNAWFRTALRQLGDATPRR